MYNFDLIREIRVQLNVIKYSDLGTTRVKKSIQEEKDPVKYIDDYKQSPRSVQTKSFLNIFSHTILDNIFNIVSNK